VEHTLPILTFDLSWYGGKQYPDNQAMRYAKAGVRNLEEIQLRLWQKSTRQTINFAVDLPDRFEIFALTGK
jgi:hypothetical protein